MFAAALTLGVLVVAAVSAQTAGPAVSIPVAAPSSAITLNHDLLSLSIEQDRWPDWAGTDAPNIFFRNTLQNLQERAGVYPWIRIGADSEDHTDFNPAVEVCSSIRDALLCYPRVN